MSESSTSTHNNQASSQSRIALSSRGRFALITVINVLCFMVLWELVARYSGISKLFLPPLSSIFADIPKMNAEGILLPNLWVSLKNFAIGLAFGIAVGVPLGFASGSIRLFDRLISPYLWALYSMPRIILIPLVFLWVGINNNARIAIVVISVIPQMAVVIMEGVKTTSGTLIRVGRSFGSSRWGLIRHIVLPSSLPYIGTALRLGMLRGLVGLFVGELFITANGIGSIIGYARSRFDTARVFAVLLIFVGFSVACLVLTRILESRMSQWRTLPNL